MSIHDSKQLGDVKVVMLKGEKGEKGDGSYDDAEIRGLLANESRDRASADASLSSSKADKTEVNELATNKADKTEVNALAERVSTSENDIHVLDARMDTFASLPSGSTSGNAELVDIRIGADGTTYSSAGDAVRGQVSDLKSDLNNIITRQIVYDIPKDSSILEYVGDQYQGTDGSLNTIAGYKLYKFTAPNDFDFWIEGVSPNKDIIVALYNAEPPYNRTFISPRYTDATLPTESNPISVAEGQIFTISLWQNTSVIIHTTGIDFGTAVTLNDNVQFTDQRYTEIKKQMLPFIGVAVESNKYTFTINGYTLPFSKTVNASTRADLWNFGGLKKGDVIIFGGGTDIVGVLQERGESDFMGGVHGDETNIEMLIYGDNEPLTDSGDYQRIDIFMNSHLTRVSTGDNVIDRVMHITIENNEIIIDNTFICLVDAFNLSYAYNGGMWAWYKANVSKVYTSYGVFDAQNATGDWAMSKDLLKTNIILSDGSQFEVENLIGRNYDKFEGEIYTYSGESNPRQKIYYATDHNSTWNSGHRCYGRCVYRLLK